MLVAALEGPHGLRPQAPPLLLENLAIKSHYGIYHPNFDNHVYRHVTIRETNTEPFNRGHDDDSVQHGVLTVERLPFFALHQEMLEALGTLLRAGAGR